MNLIKRISRNGNDRPAAIPTPFTALQRQLDRLFDDPWSDVLTEKLSEKFELPAWPAVDVSEDDKALTLKADVPGIESNDIDVQVADNLLTIRGERQSEHDETQKGRRYYERQYGSFSRSFSLPSYVDGNRIEAKCDKGVLTITLPKTPGNGSKKVAVETAK